MGVSVGGMGVSVAGAGVLVGFLVGVGTVAVGVFDGMGVGNCARTLKLSVLALQPGSVLWKTDTFNSPGK